MNDQIVAQNIANVYTTATNDAELSTQVLMGETVQCIENTGVFTKIITHDRYQGWIRTDQITDTWDTSENLRTSIASLFADVVTDPDNSAEIVTKLTCGTTVNLARRPEVGNFIPIVLPNRQVAYIHKISLNITHSAEMSVETVTGIASSGTDNLQSLKRRVIEHIGAQAIMIAHWFVGTPYLWGGTTPFGIDCSGLVQLSYRLSGLQLLRDANLQFADRRFTNLVETSLEAGSFMAGDLVAFSKAPDGVVTHIGMATGDGRFIHSLGGFGVRLDDCAEAHYNDIFVGAIRLSTDADLAIECS